MKSQENEIAREIPVSCPASRAPLSPR